jgi:hypothetical protein
MSEVLPLTGYVLPRPPLLVGLELIIVINVALDAFVEQLRFR